MPRGSSDACLAGERSLSQVARELRPDRDGGPGVAAAVADDMGAVRPTAGMRAGRYRWALQRTEPQARGAFSAVCCGHGMAQRATTTPHVPNPSPTISSQRHRQPVQRRPLPLPGRCSSRLNVYRWQSLLPTTRRPAVTFRQPEPALPDVDTRLLRRCPGHHLPPPARKGRRERWMGTSGRLPGRSGCGRR